MFTMTVSWWELVLRAAGIYVALLLMVRLSGKRTVGQYTPFDLLVMLLLSEGVSNALSGGDESVSGGLVVAVVLILLNYLASVLTSRSARFRHILEGSPKLLGADGVLDPGALRRENVAVADVEKRLREEDYTLEEVARIYLETDGNISFVHRKRTIGQE